MSDYSEVQKAYRLRPRPQEAPPGAVKISLQSSFTIEPLAAYIWKAAEGEGIPVEIHVGQYGQYAQEMMDPAGALYRFDPEMVFLFAKPGPGEAPAQRAASLEALIPHLRKNSRAALALANFIVPANPSELLPDPDAREFEEANKSLALLPERHPNVRVLDLEKLAACFGKRRVTDWKLHYLGEIDFSPEFQAYVAARCMTFVRLSRRPPRKCLVLDLDETLWGGVVGEAGSAGVALGPHGAGSEYLAFQRAILKLHERGVVLAINSKNNPEDAMEALEGHPHMILRPRHFASMKINWSDKVSNMREIASELNLGLDAFVFLDDSPVERGWVRRSLPEVLVPELPADPAHYAAFLEELDVFESPSVTDEDRRRGRMYAQEAMRKRLESTSASLEDYLGGLKMKLAVEPLSRKTLARACQMIMKTNQFNLTARRHSEGEMLSLMESPDCEIYTLDVADAYGESGISGLAVLKYEADACRVDTYLLSCRILGRRIEETFLHVLIKAAGKRARRMIGEYIPTKKNSQVKDYYRGSGFSPIPSEGAAERFELDLAAERSSSCEFHELALKGFEI